MKVQLDIPELIGHLTFDVLCDVCDTVEEFSVEDAAELDDTIKGAGWSTRKTVVGVVHFCPGHRDFASWQKHVVTSGDKRFVRAEPRKRRKRPEYINKTFDGEMEEHYPLV